MEDLLQWFLKHLLGLGKQTRLDTPALQWDCHETVRSYYHKLVLLFDMGLCSFARPKHDALNSVARLGLQHLPSQRSKYLEKAQQTYYLGAMSAIRNAAIAMEAMTRRLTRPSARSSRRCLASGLRDAPTSRLSARPVLPLRS